MSTNTSQLPDSHDSSPISYTPEDSGSDDSSNTGTQNPAVLDTHSQLRARNAELQDENTKLRAQNAALRARNVELQDISTELRIQSARLEAQVEKHVAISQMRERIAQPVEQVKQECKWHFWIMCALIVLAH